MYGDPKKPETQQGIICFKSIARDVYAAESEELKKKLTLDLYIARVINPEVMTFLNRRQDKHPVITPEKVIPKS
jgi:hypothetical protein